MSNENKPSSTNANAPATAKAGSTESSGAEAAKNPPTGPQSTKPVVGSAAPANTANGDEGPKNPINQNAQADATAATTVQSTSTDIGDPAADLTPEEEKRLERILDGEDDDAPASLSSGERDAFGEVQNKLRKLILAVPSTSPDSHTVWGAGGVTITLGDLRTLVKNL